MKKWKLTTKRGFALFIALLMCMGAMQLTAFAAEEDGLPVPEVETVTNADEPETDPVVLPEETQPVEGADETQEPADAAEPVETEQPEEPVDAVEPTEPVEVEEPSDAEPAEEEVAVPEEPEAEPVEEPTEDAEPVEAAGIEDVPRFTQFEIGDASASILSDNAYVLKLGNNTTLNGQPVRLMTNVPVSFRANEPTAANCIFVSGLTGSSPDVSAKITVGGLALTQKLVTLSNQDQFKVWTGTTSYDGTIGSLAKTLASYTVVFLADSMVSDANVGNVAQNMYFEQDNVNTYIIAYTNSQSLREITYSYDSLTTTWRLPVGAVIPMPDFTMQTGSVFKYWYIVKDGQEIQLTGNEILGDNITVYAKTEPSTGPVTPDSLAAQMGTTENMATTTRTQFTINGRDDWTTFVARSNEFRKDQTVTLADDLDLSENGAAGSYVAIPFAGNFNGDYCTISNAVFSPAVGSDNCGLFAKVESGQTVANLILENITVNSATYSGALAGYVDGGALVQNVQVRNCTVSGRTAGGISGFLFTGKIQFCSSTGVTISGQANSAGIVGISYGMVADCYSTYNGASSIFFKRAGLVASNLECGKIERCWTSSSKDYAYKSGDSYSTNVFCNVTATTPTNEQYEAAGLKAPYWKAGDGTNKVFNEYNVYLEFPEPEIPN